MYKRRDKKPLIPPRSATSDTAGKSKQLPVVVQSSSASYDSQSSQSDDDTQKSDGTIVIRFGLANHVNPIAEDIKVTKRTWDAIKSTLDGELEKIVTGRSLPISRYCKYVEDDDEEMVNYESRASDDEKDDKEEIRKIRRAGKIER